ncbi:MAG: cohesin domain-containing protein [Candidatus Sumerlaeaceae bacterium]|nr:cohesin domain-containing protein [Candidatus Sumerlaeaceae bacterium]
MTSKGAKVSREFPVRSIAKLWLVKSRVAVAVAVAISFSGLSWGQYNNNTGYNSGSSYNGSNNNNGGYGNNANTSFDSNSGFSSRISSRRGSQTGVNQTDSTQAKNQKATQDTRNKNSNQPGTKGSKPAPDAKGQTTVKGKKSTQSKGSSKGGTAAGATNIEFKMKANPASNLLFVESISDVPTMNLTTIEGEKVPTRVAFRNARHSHFDTVDVSLKYDPNVLKPVGIDDTDNSPLFSKPSLAKVDSRRGIVAYHAEFAEPMTRENMVIFKIEWKALQPAESSAISFMNTADFPSRILDGDVNALLQKSETGEVEVSDNAGLLGADITVVPTAETLKRDEDRTMTGVLLANSISQGKAEGEIKLSLRANENRVQTGQEFLVDIVYSNPRGAEVDSVKLNVQFDPKVLQVVDYDEDNWITNGVNVYDGKYHEDLPFDFHIRNNVYNNRGQILYEMGFKQRVRIPTSGVLATVKFKAVNAAPVTEISFNLGDNGKETATAMSFLGFNLIGIPGERGKFLNNAVLTVN